MRKIVAVVLYAIAPVLAFSQNTETRSLGSFTGLKVAEGISVYLKKGEKEGARIEATGTDVSNVLTEISGSYLKVHMEDGRYRNASVKVYLTYVQLDRLSAGSAASIFADAPLKARSIEISASSAGTVEVGIEADDLEVSASSAADVELTGTAKTATFEVSSAGEIDAYDVDAQEVSAEASSGGSIKLSVTKSLRANASSGGHIRYKGNPDRQNTNSSSGGSVKKY